MHVTIRDSCHSGISCYCRCPPMTQVALQISRYFSRHDERAQWEITTASPLTSRTSHRQCLQTLGLHTAG